MPLRFPGIAKLSPFAVALICAIGALNGCKKEDEAIILRTVPKQPAPSSQPTTMGAMPEEMAAAVSASKTNSGNGQVNWKLPEGWKELPGDGKIRYATIQVDPAHPELVLTVIPLEGDTGGMLANVNRWRGELTLPAITQADLAGNVSQMELNGAKVYTVNLLAPESVNPRTATLAAAVPHEDRTWFFKLKGPAEAVTSQKEKFDAFIKTIAFADSGEPKASKAQAAANASNSDPLRYVVPAGWVKDEPQPMRTVSFHIGEGSEKVDIIVSQLPAGSSGTELDNINRWRGLVGLPAIGQGEMPASQPIKVGGRDGVLFDFIGPAQPAPAKRQVVARVTYGNDFWFFKMIGNDPQVRQQQANFDRFLQSVQFIAASAPAAKP